MSFRFYLAMREIPVVFSNFARNRKGQDLIEYALVVALIAFAAAAGMSSVATKISDTFIAIGAKISTYTS